MNETGLTFETRMHEKDLKQLQGLLTAYYTPIFTVSKEAAAAIEKMIYKTNAVRDQISDPINDDISDGVVTEEVLRQSGYDQALNETLAVLEEEVKKIAPGTLQYTGMQNMIDAMEQTRRREYVAHVENRETANFPGFVITQKIANYTIIPKVDGITSVETTNEKGEKVTEYRFPAGFAEDNPDVLFIPRQDQLKEQTVRPKFSKEELDQSAERINFDGLISSGSQYMRALREINNIISIQPPETPEQERILRDRVRTAAQRMRMEVQAIHQTIDPEDHVALRFFGNSQRQMMDTLSADPKTQRALGRDYEVIDNFIAYLDSGLPMSAFTEYQEAKRYALGFQDALNGLGNAFEGVEDLKKEAGQLVDYVTKVPANMKPEEVQDWLQGMRNHFKTCVDRYEEIAKKPKIIKDQMQKLAEKNFHENDVKVKYLEEKALKNNVPQKEVEASFSKHLNKVQEDPKYQSSLSEAQKKRYKSQQQDYLDRLQNPKNQLGKFVQNIKGAILPPGKKLGDRNLAERREYLGKMIDSMSDDMKNIRDDLLKQIDAEGELHSGNAGMLGSFLTTEKVRGMSPKEFLKRFEVWESALRDGKGEVNKEDQKIWDCLQKNREYFENRMKEAESKGILSDMPLSQQKSVIEGKNINDALKQFNTERSGVFRKESPEHKDLNQKANEFIKAKKALRDFEYKKGGTDKLPPWENVQWNTLKQQVRYRAGEVKKSAENYINKKSQNPYTSAGKERLMGAQRLLWAAENIEDIMQVEANARKRYEEISNSTAEMEADNKKREVELQERAQRIQEERIKERPAEEAARKAAKLAAEKAEASRKFRETRNDLEAQKNEVEKENRSKEAPVGPRKPTNLENLAGKFEGKDVETKKKSKDDSFAEKKVTAEKKNTEKKNTEKKNGVKKIVQDKNLQKDEELEVVTG